MAGLKISKNIILPRLDKIRDPETRRVFQQLLKAIKNLNTICYNDLTHLEERITDLEP